ncbi:LacI family DNA-binding transcriptional regulator [soil metagenome]
MSIEVRHGTRSAGVTAQDVARLAEVSQSAVSRTFTPGASVSESTRERVLAAARRLGYRPNAIARSLITRRSHIVALFMTYLDNQFYPLVIEQLSQKLQRHGYHVLMFIGDELDDSHSVLTEILQYQVDAIVLASATLSADLARQCADSGVPVVEFNRVSQTSHRSSTSNSVTSDNRRGGQLVADLLLSRGLQRLAFLAGMENSSTSVEREQGFTEALAAAGMKVHRRAVGHYDFEQAKVATRELFGKGRKPDAVFVANDHMAIAAMDVLRGELGLRVPDDVSVVGFDDVAQADWGAYRLTTVRQDVEAMTEATVDLLRQQIGDSANPRHLVMPCSIVLRESVRAA